MWYPTIRNVTATCTLAAALLAVPAESRACCDWLFGGWGARSTYSAPAWGSTYAPTYAPAYSSTCNTCAPQSCAPVCSPAPCNSCATQPAATYYSGSTCSSCTTQPTTTYYYGGSTCNSCTTQTVRYLPQTSYQTVYRAVPVTTYQAYTHPAFLTGWPVTSYRPVTTWTYQATAVPQTTYRPVYADTCGSCGTCDTCGTSAVSSGCSSCGVGTTISSATGTGASGSDAGSPSYPSGGAGAGQDVAPKTFEEPGGTSIETDKPIPDPATSSIPGPSLTDPASRTTFREIRQAVHFVPVTSSSAGDSRPTLDAGGWSVSRD